MDLSQAQAAIAAQQLLLNNQSFRAPPPVPSSCCGKGCTECVWLAYFKAVDYWLEDAQQLIE